MKLEVVLVSGKNPFQATPGGTHVYIQGLLQFLGDEDHDISLLSSEIDGFEKRELKFQHVPIRMKRETSIDFLINLFLKIPGLGIPKSSIIHVHRPDFVLPFLIYNRNNPKVCTMHGIPNIGIRTRKNVLIWSIYNLLEIITIKRCDILIMVDQRTRDYYIKKYPHITDKTTLIPVGIDTNVFKPMDMQKMRKRYGLDQNEAIILFIGRFSKEKGLYLLLDSFRELHPDLPTARLVLLGKGSEGKKIIKYIENERIEKVTIFDPVEHKRVPEIINCADTLVLCSSFEGMPTVVLESLACGVPVVSTDVGDVKKVVIDDKSGFLVKTADEQSIKNSILRVIKNGRSMYSDYCRDVAMRYSWETITKEIKMVYSDLSSSK